MFVKGKIKFGVDKKIEGYFDNSINQYVSELNQKYKKCRNNIDVEFF